MVLDPFGGRRHYYRPHRFAGVAFVADDEAKQLVVMQRILMRQDVGYFLISGCGALQQHAEKLLTAVQPAECGGWKRIVVLARLQEGGGASSSYAESVQPSSSFGDRVTKWTLWTSTGEVKTNFNPPQFAQVACPAGCPRTQQ